MALIPLHYVLMQIMFKVYLFCYFKGLPFRITQAVNEVIPGYSTTKTHKEGRAVDFSVKGWSNIDIEEFIDYMQMYNCYGAYSYSDYKQRIVILHDVGLGWHIHMQIKRGLGQEEIYECPNN